MTDGWGGYNGLTERGYRHVPVALAGNPALVEDYLPIVHLMFGNLKNWLRGCHHGVSPQHLQAYLNEFAFRLNCDSTRSTHSGPCSGSVVER